MPILTLYYFIMGTSKYIINHSNSYTLIKSTVSLIHVGQVLSGCGRVRQEIGHLNVLRFVNNGLPVLDTPGSWCGPITKVLTEIP